MYVKNSIPNTKLPTITFMLSFMYFLFISIISFMLDDRTSLLLFFCASFICSFSSFILDFIFMANSLLIRYLLIKVVITESIVAKIKMDKTGDRVNTGLNAISIVVTTAPVMLII